MPVRGCGIPVLWTLGTLMTTSSTTKTWAALNKETKCYRCGGNGPKGDDRWTPAKTARALARAARVTA